MSAPATAADSLVPRVRDLSAHLERMKTTFIHRTNVMARVQAVREGDIRSLFPNDLQFDDEFMGVPAANWIDNVAHDLMEGIAFLPEVNSVSGQVDSERGRRRAQRKDHVVDYFWRHSHLQRWMFSIADQFITAGWVGMYVEPDVIAKCPRIRFFESMGSYYELDRDGNTINFAHTEMHTVDELVARYGADPLIRMAIQTNKQGKQDSGSTQLEVVQWFNKTHVILFSPDRDGLVLASYAHKLSRVPVRVVERPGFSRKTPRGQFDDVIWVQVARAMMGLYALKAAAKMVNAPTQLPKDVDELSIGADAIIQTDGQVKTVDMSINPQVFAENQVLDNELRTGSRYPDVRTGELQASVITGKGVEALLGTFDSQIRGDQMAFKDGLEELSSMALEMDEVWWSGVSKLINGLTVSGSYEFTYDPAEHAHRWGVTVTYGFMTGLKPAQALVSALQLAGGGLISTETAVSKLPFDIDVDQEMRKVNSEQARQALKQGVFALVQSSGMIASQGGDAMGIIKLGVDFIKNLESGNTVEDAAQAAYETMQQDAQQQAQEAAAEQQQQQPGPGGGGPGAPQGLSEALPPGVAQGQAGQPPGGRPTVEDLVASLRGSGQANNAVALRRRQATGY